MMVSQKTNFLPISLKNVREQSIGNHTLILQKRFQIKMLDI